MSRINLIKKFNNEEAEVFNKISNAYEMGRADEIDECIEAIKECQKAADNALIIFGMNCAIKTLEEMKDNNE